MGTPEENLRAIFEMAAKFGYPMSDVVTCKACKTKNRLKPGKTKPRCGKCGLPL